MPADLPPFVVDREWRDPAPHPVLGSRQHPYDPEHACALVMDHARLIFPSMAAALGHLISMTTPPDDQHGSG